MLVQTLELTSVSNGGQILNSSLALFCRLFEEGSTLSGKYLLPLGANSFPLEQIQRGANSYLIEKGIVEQKSKTGNHKSSLPCKYGRNSSLCIKDPLKNTMWPQIQASDTIYIWRMIRLRFFSYHINFFIISKSYPTQPDFPFYHIKRWNKKLPSSLNKWIVYVYYWI